MEYPATPGLWGYGSWVNAGERGLRRQRVGTHAAPHARRSPPLHAHTTPRRAPNAGAWQTTEARMMLAYYRVGLPDLALRSMATQFTRFALPFRMDSPLQNFGETVYQPDEPVRTRTHARSTSSRALAACPHLCRPRSLRAQVNIVIDAFGVNAALVRGLFEYM